MINVELDPEEYYEKFRFFIENINDLIYVVDSSKDFIIHFINEQVHINLLGYTNHDLIGKSILIFIHPKDVRKAHKILKRAHDGDGRFEEIRLKDINRHYVWFEFKVKKFKDSKNNKQILIIAKNISEKKSLEEKIKDETDKLRGLTNAIPEIRF